MTVLSSMMLVVNDNKIKIKYRYLGMFLNIFFTVYTQGKSEALLNVKETIHKAPSWVSSEYAYK